jgi:hypothetical protein
MASTVQVGNIIGGTTTTGGAGDEGIAQAIHAGLTHPAPYQGSAPLLANNLIDPGLPIGAETFTLGAPGPSVLNFSVDICEGFAGDLYNRIHVIPAVINLGNVLTDENQDVEVWNAHFVQKTLAVVTESGTQGITLLTPGATPFVFNPGASFKGPYSVLITTDGPATIEAQYLFDFTAETPPESPTLRITGQRVISFPFDFERPFQERLSFLTNVLTSEAGNEQRIRARKLPRTVLKVNHLIPDDEQLRSQVLNKIYGTLGSFFAVPMFQWARDLVSDLSIGATVIPVDTVEADFRDSTAAVTHAIMLWRSPTDFEILQIAIGGLTATDITVDLPTTIAHTAGDTLVIPLEVALSADPLAWEETRNGRITLKVQWLMEDVTDLADLSSLPTNTDGVPVLDDPNFIDRRLSVELEKSVTVFDGGVGVVSPLGGRDAPQPRLVKGFNTRTRAAAWTLRLILYGLRGKQKSFWLSTHRNDFVLTTGVGAGDVNLAVLNTDYNLFVNSIGSWRGIRIELNDGTVFHRRITASAPGGIPGEEQITMDSSLGQAFAVVDVKRISLLMLVRSATDNVDLFWSSVDNLQVRLLVAGAPE